MVVRIFHSKPQMSTHWFPLVCMLLQDWCHTWVITKALHKKEMKNDHYDVLTFIASVWFSSIVGLVDSSRFAVGAVTLRADGEQKLTGLQTLELDMFVLWTISIFKHVISLLDYFITALTTRSSQYSPVLLPPSHALFIHWAIQLTLTWKDDFIVDNDGLDDLINVCLACYRILSIWDGHQGWTKADCQIVWIHHVLVTVLGETEGQGRWALCVCVVLLCVLT